MFSVALVSMPFNRYLRPSIGLSLLQAGLNRTGVSSKVHYFSIRFAERIGGPLYDVLAADAGKLTFHELAGEWLFRDVLFGEDERNREKYVESILRRREAWPPHAHKQPLPEPLIRRILGIRKHILPFIDECAAEVVASGAAVVGLSSVFQQHTASLALAKRIKALSPATFIVLGGANCEGVMGAETLRQFAFVDAAVSGEGDVVFPELVRRVQHGESVEGLPGVRTRAGIEDEFRAQSFSSAPMVFDMDMVPSPDYRDFFEQYESSEFAQTFIPGLYVETSRGCWWGEKMHCTFCGLNGTTMKYRSKSALRAVEELRTLSRQYPGCDIQVTDNILDMKYFADFIPMLAGEKLDVELFYETKSNLRKDQLRALRAAGITRLQPGIESLSDPVLRLMRKGVSAFQNIQVLKWCKELGIRPIWNLLWGFPGERAEDYARMARLIPQLRHLTPPDGFGGLRLDRFSPNFVESRAFGLTNVRPLAPYHYIYPFPLEVVSNLAYYFDFDYGDGRDVSSYVEPVHRAIRAWKEREETEELLLFDNGRHASVWDLRRGRKHALTTLTGLDRFLYVQCDSMQDVSSLAKAARAAAYGDVSEAHVAERLAFMTERGILLQDEHRYLAIAVPVGEYQPSAAVLKQLRSASVWARRPRPTPSPEALMQRYLAASPLPLHA